MEYGLRAGHNIVVLARNPAAVKVATDLHEVAAARLRIVKGAAALGPYVQTLV